MALVPIKKLIVTSFRALSQLSGVTRPKEDKKTRPLLIVIQKVLNDIGVILHIPIPFLALTPAPGRLVRVIRSHVILALNQHQDLIMEEIHIQTEDNCCDFSMRNV